MARDKDKEKDNHKDFETAKKQLKNFSRNKIEKNRNIKWMILFKKVCWTTLKISGNQ